MPTDSEGRKCGVDNGVVNEKYLLFFNLEKCIDPTVPLFGCKTTQVCVRECPSTSFTFDKYQCNQSTLPTIREKLICKKGIDKFSLRECVDVEDHVSKGLCARWYLPSTPCKLSGHCLFTFICSQCHYNCFRLVHCFEYSFSFSFYL